MHPPVTNSWLRRWTIHAGTFRRSIALDLFCSGGVTLGPRRGPCPQSNCRQFVRLVERERTEIDRNGEGDITPMLFHWFLESRSCTVPNSTKGTKSERHVFLSVVSVVFCLFLLCFLCLCLLDGVRHIRVTFHTSVEYSACHDLYTRSQRARCIAAIISTLLI